MSQTPDIPITYYENFTSIGSTLYFTAIKDFNEGHVLWKSDGTTAGTVRLKTIAAHRLTVVKGTLYFTAKETDTGYELWKSDGTPSGTIKIKDVPLQIPDYYEGYHRMPIQLVATGHLLYFTSDNGLDGYDLWRTDGTTVGTIKVTHVNLIYYDIAMPTNFTSVGDVLYFDELEGIIKTDGTPQGTVYVKKISSYSIEILKQANGTVYLNYGPNGLWKTDGTEAGTVPVYKWPYGTNIAFEKASIAIENTFYFLTVTIKQYPLPEDYALWKSDGTEAGTVKIKEFKSLLTSLTAVGNRLYFTTAEAGNGEELWTSDGTTAGTIKLKSTNSYVGSASPTAVNGTLFFRGNNGYPDDIWKSDGTIAGTVLVKDIHPGNTSQVNNLTNVNGTLYFSAYAYPYSTIESLWKSNGTEAGTMRVFDVIGPAVSCSATGSILQEKWLNITGYSVSAIPVSTASGSSAQLTSFETTSNTGNNYGERIRGYLCAPYTGSYVFYLAGDDQCELWLSSDENPAKKTRIASVSSYSGPREWNKYPSQQSALISLVAGKKYYIEALHKEATGGDHLAVGWQTPASYILEVIPGSVLSPFIIQTPTPTGKITREFWANVTGYQISNIPLTTPATTTDQITIFERVTNQGDNYGQRFRGYLHPQVSGNYRFFVAGDDKVELWLSTDEDPTKKTKIASLTAPSSLRQWNKYASQQSIAISLVAGKKYYIEALHKENTGSDHLSVGWQLPSQTTISVIAGTYLSPFLTAPAASIARAGVEENLESQVSLYPNPFEDKLTLASEHAGTHYLSVVDNLGRVVYQGTTQGTQTELNLSHLKAGVYVVKVSAQDGKTQVIRVVKK